MLPATLGDLLAEAEFAAGLLTARRPDARSIAPGWNNFIDTSERLLLQCLGPRAGINPVDAAIANTIRVAHRPRRAGREWTDRLPIGNDSLRAVNNNLGAACDLLALHPRGEPDDERAVAARAAGIIAAVSYAAATAERHRHHEPMAYRALHLQRAASRVLDASAGRASSSHLDALTAEPLSVDGQLPGAAARFQAATLAWRRAASATNPPSRQTLLLNALTMAQTTAHVWPLAEATLAGAPSEALVDAKARFVAAYRSWREVAATWRTYTSATPAPIEHRALADEVVRSGMDLSRGSDTLDPIERTERLLAVEHGMTHLSELAQHDAATTQMLVQSGRLYVPANTLKHAEPVVVGRQQPLVGVCPTTSADRFSDVYREANSSLGAATRTLALVSYGNASASATQPVWVLPTPNVRAPAGRPLTHP